MRLRDDAWRSNRTPLVLTQVDPRNKPSMDLFSRFGFVDEGPDPNDPEYHLLSLEFTGTNYVIGDQQGFPAAFHRNIPIAFVRDLFGLAVNTRLSKGEEEINRTPGKQAIPRIRTTIAVTRLLTLLIRFLILILQFPVFFETTQFFDSHAEHFRNSVGQH